MIAFVNFAQAQIEDSVTMNAAYSMDVFYSLENSTVQSVAGSEWTIAFSTGAQTSSIYINDGRGVELYKTTVNIANFENTLDTTGIESWTQLHNEYNDWDHSAFEDGATGHPNYGWGSYNAVSHIVNGDKVFVLKSLNNEYYKAMVVKKASGAWHYRYATLNNSFDTTIVYQASDLIMKNFAYLNMDNNTILDREPANNTWDMLFTKYYDVDQTYILTGILLNRGVEAIQIDGVPVEDATYVGSTFDTNTKTIGADWKSFNMSTYLYDLVADRSYFVKQKDGDIYKIVLTGFTGSSTGKTFFTKEKLEVSTAINNIEAINSLGLYPNPSRNTANLVIDSKNNTEISYTIYNMVGKAMDSNTAILNTGLNALQLNVANYSQGVYLVQVQNGNQTQTLKLNVIK